MSGPFQATAVRATDATFRVHGDDAVYFPREGPPKKVTILKRSPDTVIGFGDSRSVTNANAITVRAAEVAAPVAGDVLEIDSSLFVVQGEPLADTRGITWSLDTAPYQDTV